MYRYWAKVDSVYDGDTITCTLDLGFGLRMENQKIRLFGIDTPELRGKERPEGLVSRNALQSRIDGAGGWVEIRTIKDKKGKFGRWLGEIFIGEENINQWLVDRGLARVYLP